MGSVRTVWHVMFGDLLEERKPPGFEVQREAPLGGEPQRADYLLLRRVGEASADDQAGVLRRLWSKIRTDALVELKSPSRPVERGDLMRLLGYGLQYAVKEQRHTVKGREQGRFGELEDLLLVLATPRMTPTLRAEIDFLPGVAISAPKDGYAVVRGLFFPALVILLSEVSEAERDAVLALFGDKEPWSPEAEHWLDAHLWGTKSERKGIKMENLEGYEEMKRRLIKRIPPEERLYGLEPDEVAKALAGLPPEQIVEMLNHLPPELLERFQKERKQ